MTQSLEQAADEVSGTCAMPAAAAVTRAPCPPAEGHSVADQRRLLARFWMIAAGFWTHARWRSWPITAALIVIVLLQLAIQYGLNVWNRDFFNALERRDSTALWTQAVLFVPLAGLSIALAIASVWGRMTAQRRWREWVTKRLVEYWLSDGRYRQLAATNGVQNPEYRIAEDTRIATDAPIDFALGLLTSLLTAGTFIGVLWSVGGHLPLDALGEGFAVPRYLVLGVVAYAAAMTTGVLMIGRRLTRVIEDKNQAEAELIAAAAQLRESLEWGPGPNNLRHGRVVLRAALRYALAQWRKLCGQLMRTTLVSHSNMLLAPVVAWLLCAPKYLAGSMSLGELTQATAAFIMVQGAFNWLVDNYHRAADWASSVNRVTALLLSLDALAPAGPPARRDDAPELEAQQGAGFLLDG
jgi:vitamin B12/bleomycin/antimicrobial peptide transport system ATP-binding/permease protein